MFLSKLFQYLSKKYILRFLKIDFSGFFTFERGSFQFAFTLQDLNLVSGGLFAFIEFLKFFKTKILFILFIFSVVGLFSQFYKIHSILVIDKIIFNSLFNAQFFVPLLGLNQFNSVISLLCFCFDCNIFFRKERWDPRNIFARFVLSKQILLGEVYI